jgi:alkaline phosphatase D
VLSQQVLMSKMWIPAELLQPLSQMDIVTLNQKIPE